MIQGNGLSITDGWEDGPLQSLAHYVFGLDALEVQGAGLGFWMKLVPAVHSGLSRS